MKHVSHLIIQSNTFSMRTAVESHLSNVKRSKLIFCYCCCCCNWWRYLWFRHSIVQYQNFWQLFNYIYSTVIHAQIISKWALEHGSFSTISNDCKYPRNASVSIGIRWDNSKCEWAFHYAISNLSVLTAISSKSTAIRTSITRRMLAHFIRFESGYNNWSVYAILLELEERSQQIRGTDRGIECVNVYKC